MSDDQQADERDPAVARFMVIQAMRASGAVIALFGIAILSQRFPALAGVPKALGTILMVAGLADFVVIPLVLARKWRSPR